MGFRPGHFDISWMISYACDEKGNTGSESGQWSFDIVPMENPNLKSKFADLLAHAQSKDEESLRENARRALLGDAGLVIEKYSYNDRQLRINQGIEGLRPPDITAGHSISGTARWRN